METVRIDKWLWAARFFKTRSLAVQEIESHHVLLNALDVKPSKDVRVGDVVTVIKDKVKRIVVVKGISEQRGSATVAQLLYEETVHSMEQRALIAERNRLSPEPALMIEKGRPTKQDRRQLQRVWNSRWSASVD